MAAPGSENRLLPPDVLLPNARAEETLVIIGLANSVTVAGEVGTLADFAKAGRIQLHHEPHHMAKTGGEARPAWWADVFSRDTIDAARYEISREDYEALLAAPTPEPDIAE